MPSCAVLQSATAIDVPDATIIACEGDIQKSSWTVIDLWPHATEIVARDPKQASAEEAREPAERTYKRALDIARHIRSSASDQREIATLTADKLPSAPGGARHLNGNRRLTLREFSERFISSRREREA